MVLCSPTVCESPPSFLSLAFQKYSLGLLLPSTMQLTENHSGDPQAMATRSALIECLSSATAVDLLGMLDDEPLFNLATRYFERFPKADMAASPSTVHSGIQPVLEPVIHSDAQSATEPVAQPVAQPIGQPAVQANDAASPGPSRDRIKRPLNGFMAFRRKFIHQTFSIPIIPRSNLLIQATT